MKAETFFVCGYCGVKKPAEQMIILSEDDYPGYGQPKELARPAVGRRVHQCGFLAIRCKSHKNAEKNAHRAMMTHLRAGGRVPV